MPGTEPHPAGPALGRACRLVCTRPITGPAPPADVELEWVSDAAGVEAFTHIVDTAYQSLGAAAVGLQASPMGEPVYRHMGYRELYRQTGLVRFATPTT